MASKTFLGEHEDFVLKLKIKADDGKLKESQEITMSMALRTPK
jgi:hypothetical protein